MVGRRLGAIIPLAPDSKMNLFEFLVLVLATFSLSVVVFFLFRVLFPPTVVVVEAEPPVRWWPWSITSYNHWPYWMSGGVSSDGGRGSGGSGGGGSNHNGGHIRPHHKGADRGHAHQGLGHVEGGQSRPWGDGQRGANGGGFHQGASSPTPSTTSLS